MEFDLAETWRWCTTDALPYTPPLGYAFLFAFVGQLMKRFVFNEANIRAAGRTRDRLWNAGGAKRVLGGLLKVAIGTPLPLHPALAAFPLALLALPMVPGLPDGYLWRLLVLLVAAIGSLGLYDLGHAVLRRRGLDFRFPGEPPRVARTRRRRARARARLDLDDEYEDDLHLADDELE